MKRVGGPSRAGGVGERLVAARGPGELAGFAEGEVFRRLDGLGGTYASTSKVVADNGGVAGDTAWVVRREGLSASGLAPIG